MTDMRQVAEDVAHVAAGFARDSLARGKRGSLERADFHALVRAGFLLTGVPADAGGLWQDQARSLRGVADLVHTVARADPSVALVAAMHPSVLIAWLSTPDGDAAWRSQRDWVFQTARDGHWWGTVTSEPGSGGDVLRTRSRADPEADPRPGGPTHRITGDKHFGSGSGIASFMITTAVAPGEDAADVFVLDLTDARWDGSSGMTLLRSWDGIGMRATQSHAFRFDSYPARRIAAPVIGGRGFVQVGQTGSALFLAVVLAVVENAVEWSGARLAGERLDAARPFERVEWVNACNDAWLMRQAFEGALRAVEADARDAAVTVARAKYVGAELAERCLLRLGRVVGGSGYSTSQPLAQWAEDVRALGFLRPPWGLAVDQLTRA